MGVDFGREGRSAEDAMVATLVEVHQRKRRQSAGSDPGGAQARILDHFDRRGQRLRGERLITAELIERLFRASAAIPPRRAHQELEIWGAADAVAAGRVRITNRSASLASFDLVVGEPIDGGRPAEIRCEPATGALAPNESLLVRVQARLTGFQPGDRTTVPLECRWREGTDRVWLVIGAHVQSGRRP